MTTMKLSQLAERWDNDEDTIVARALAEGTPEDVAVFAKLLCENYTAETAVGEIAKLAFLLEKVADEGR